MAQKLKAMKNYKKAQFVYNLVVYSLTAFLSTLFYLYLFCFPSMRQFLFDFLPNIYSFFLNPKFLFMLGNIIVIILVGESKLVAGSRSSPATEIYAEYVERSRSLRQQSSSVVVECKKKDIGNPEMEKNKKSRMRRHYSLNNIRCLEVKKKEMAAGRSLRRPQSVVEHKKDGRLELHESEKTITRATGGDFSCPEIETATFKSEEREYNDLRSLEGKKKSTVGQGLTRPMSLGTLQMQYENEKTTMATVKFLEEKREENAVSQSLTRPQSLGILDMYENEKTSSDGDDVHKMSFEEKRKDMEQSMDDLNRRVEEFIARVNRQRMIEARKLDSSLD